MTTAQRRRRHKSLPFDALAADLRDRVDGEVRFDPGSRGAYSTDASNYRQIPIGVVVPKTPHAAEQAVAVCREHDVPVLSRGGGTSLAGQCCNVAVVIDWSKYCTGIVSVDVDHRTAIVEPLQLHHRGHDRKQFVRRHGAGLRQDGRLRAGT
jgi:hypothetical protein